MDSNNRTGQFITGTGISPDNDDITFGLTNASFSPAGVEAVMTDHCKQVDELLAKLPLGSVTEMELFHTRGFTFAEWQALFDIQIREKDFYQHPAIRSLWLTKEHERRKIIYNLDRQSFNDYFTLLAKCLARFNPHLLTFFFRTIATCQISFQIPVKPYPYYRAFG